MSQSPTAAAKGLASCHLCLKLVAAEHHHCPRCGASVHLRKPDSLTRTLALLITAVILYIPANIYPIMIADQLGTIEPSTIIGGVILLIDMGSAPIALVIFFASVMVPIGKMLSMFYLCWSLRHAKRGTERQRTVTYRITEFIGKWSMIDVFVVSILVALIQLGSLISFKPGIAAVAFAGVVIVTMIAAESFDPRIMWDLAEKDDE